MWKDKLLKRGWRLFIIMLYLVMIACIVARIFPLSDSFSETLGIIQILDAVCILTFAWFYYYKPTWLRKQEVE
jgi:hypothetical protein